MAGTTPRRFTMAAMKHVFWFLSSPGMKFGSGTNVVGQGLRAADMAQCSRRPASPDYLLQTTCPTPGLCVRWPAKRAEATIGKTKNSDVLVPDPRSRTAVDAETSKKKTHKEQKSASGRRLQQNLSQNATQSTTLLTSVPGQKPMTMKGMDRDLHLIATPE